METDKLIKSPYDLNTRTFMAPEAKTVNLTIGERLSTLRILNEFRGPLEVLRVILEDIKPIPVTEEEWKECNLVKSPAADGNENWKWDEKVTKDITLQAETYGYLLKSIKEKSDAGSLSLQDMPLIAISDKLTA